MLSWAPYSRRAERTRSCNRAPRSRSRSRSASRAATSSLASRSFSSALASSFWASTTGCSRRHRASWAERSSPAAPCRAGASEVRTTGMATRTLTQVSDSLTRKPTTRITATTASQASVAARRPLTSSLRTSPVSERGLPPGRAGGVGGRDELLGRLAHRVLRVQLLAEVPGLAQRLQRRGYGGPDDRGHLAGRLLLLTKDPFRRSRGRRAPRSLPWWLHRAGPASAPARWGPPRRPTPRRSSRPGWPRGCRRRSARR